MLWISPSSATWLSLAAVRLLKNQPAESGCASLFGFRAEPRVATFPAAVGVRRVARVTPHADLFVERSVGGDIIGWHTPCLSGSLFNGCENSSEPASIALGAGVLQGVFEIAALGDTDEPLDDAVVVFDDKRRQRSHLVLVCDLLLLVDIDLGELHVLVVGLQLLKDRILRLTRATPVGVKVCQSNSHRAANRCADAGIRVSTPSLTVGEDSGVSRNA